MKRSEINAILKDAVAFVDRMNFKLPPFAYWSPEDWAERGHAYDEIRDNMLGWDITDFGHGDYRNLGLLLFTLRNGNAADARYKKTYAEKILLVDVNQITPCHFHWSKTEDIINRGGGTLVIEVFNSNPDGTLADTDVEIFKDGGHFTVPAGSLVRLLPGESISIQTGMYHKFWAEGERVLVGEVSMVNDDCTDNRFYLEMGRFPEIEEDAPALYLLCNEYPKAR